MKQRSGNLSASSLQTWEECQQQYVAKYVEGVKQPGTAHAANVGTAFHYACEHFVNAVYIAKTHEWDDLAYLEKLYEIGYEKAFGTFNKLDKQFKDGLALVKKWHGYTDLSDPDITVLSTESKEIIKIDNEHNLTYILDRCDWIEKDGLRKIRVVDYKTTQIRLSYEDIRDKLQARIYALAMMIQYKSYNPDVIIVCLDQVRHDGMSGVAFTREECIETWEYLVKTSQLITRTDPADATYTLGPGCKYCPIKLRCPEMQRNIASGGIMSIQSTDEAVDLYVKLQAQIDGNKTLLGELADKILEDAKHDNKLQWDSGNMRVKITSRGTRGLTDTEQVAKIIGPSLMARIGKINIGEIDKLMQGGLLSEEQSDQINKLIGKTYSDPSVKIAPMPVIGGKGK